MTFLNRLSFTLLLILFGSFISFGQFVDCANNNNDEPLYPAPGIEIVDGLPVFLEINVGNLNSTNNDFCIGNSGNENTAAGCGTFFFTNIPIPEGIDGSACPTQFCFSPRQGCGAALGNVCLWQEDSNNLGSWENLGSPEDATNFCFEAAPGATEYAITICRPGNGPVSIVDVEVTVPPSLELGPDQDICIDDLPSVIDLTTSEPAGQAGGEWSDLNGLISNPTDVIIDGVVGDNINFTYCYDESDSQGYSCTVCATVVYTIIEGCCVEIPCDDGNCATDDIFDSVICDCVFTPNDGIPDADAGSDGTLACNIFETTLNGSSSTAGATYLWTSAGGSGITSPADQLSITVNIPGVYLLTVTALNGCTATDEAVVIMDDTPPDVDAGLDASLSCNVFETTLTGSSSTPGATYLWTSGGGGITSPADQLSITVNLTGTYTLTVTGPNGCLAVDNAEVLGNYVEPDVNAGADATLSCGVMEVSLNGSSTTTGASYSWSANGGGGIVSGGDTATPVINLTGTYTLTVTGENGCTAQDDVDVNGDFAEPNANAGSDMLLTCSTTEVSLNGSSTTTEATYQWTSSTGGGFTSASNISNPTVNAPGTYTLTVTGPNGCTTTDDVDVNADLNAPDASAEGGSISCGNTSVQLMGSSTIADVSYSWTDPTGVIIEEQNPTVSILGTYVLTVTNPINGCTQNAVAMVDGDESLPDADAGSDGTLACNIFEATLSGSSTTPDATYLWTSAGGSGITSPADQLTITVNIPGIYTLTVTAPNGCTATDEAVVIMDDTPPDVDAGLDATLSCNVFETTLTGSSSTPGATYLWTSAAGIISPADQLSITVNLTGTYTLTVTGLNGCLAVDNAEVLGDYVEPDVNAGADATLSCGVMEVSLDGSSTTEGATYSWSANGGGGIASGGDTATPVINLTGTYTLTVTGENGCTAEDDVAVNGDFAEPNANAGLDMLLTCGITEVTLNGSSTTTDATYQWTSSTGGGFTSASNIANPTVNAPGTYTLTVTGPNGCMITDDVDVNADLNAPDAIAVGGTIDCENPTIQLQGSSTTTGVTYFWTDPTGAILNEQNPVVSITGTYVLTVTSTENACTQNAIAVVDADGTIPSCDDNDCTTEDSYDVTICACVNTPIETPSCDDNDCTTEDSYDTTICACVNTPIPPPSCDECETYNTDICACEAIPDCGTDTLIVNCHPNLEFECNPDSSGAIVYWSSVTATTTCATGGVSCLEELEGFTYLGSNGGSSYFYSDEVERWETANLIATSLGGYLLVINDAAEQAFVQQNVTGATYIGLSDSNGDDIYEWVNGDPVDYTNWNAPSQPSNGSDNYVAMLSWDSYEWDDLNYWVKKKFIVEIECGAGGGSDVSVVQTLGPPSGSFLDEGDTYTVVYTATDNCGNMETCSFDVSVGSCDDCTLGSPCDDGDDCTELDAYDANCDCVGQYLDSDSDGYCDAEDCAISNPDLPAVPGSTCDDGDPDTENDLILSDGCTCEGTSSSDCNIAYTTSVNEITITGLSGPHVQVKIFDVDNGWNTVFECSDNCDNPEVETLSEGNYYLNAKIYDASWNLTCLFTEYFYIEGGVCDNVTEGGVIAYDESFEGAYDPEPIVNESSPSGGSGDMEYLWLASYTDCPNGLGDAIPGSNMLEYDPGPITQTTYYLRCSRRVGCTTWFESNCIVKEVTGSNPNCNVTYTASNNALTVEGLDGAHVSVKLFNSNWATVYNCFNDCDNPTFIDDLPGGTYYLNVEMWDASWNSYCTLTEYVSIPSGNGLESEAELEDLFFVANKNGRVANLYWVTNTESKNDYFVIERSYDNSTFETLAEVTSRTNDLGNYTYQDLDDLPLPGVNYYRIKEVFKDGSFIYSTVRKVEFEIDVKDISVYPNPTAGEIYASLKRFEGSAASIKIYNSIGILMDEITLDEITNLPIAFDTDRYADGIYMMRIKVGDLRQITVSFVVNRW